MSFAKTRTCAKILWKSREDDAFLLILETADYLRCHGGQDLEFQTADYLRCHGGQDLEFETADYLRVMVAKI